VVTLGADRRGAGAVEFAIVASAFLTLLLLILEVAWQVAIAAGLDHGARQATRWVATGQAPPEGWSTESELRRRIVSASGLPLEPARLGVLAESFANPGALLTPGAAMPGLGGAEQVVRYRITYASPALTPIARGLLPAGELLHTLSVIVRNEPYVVN